MNRLSRNLSIQEKILLLVFAVILIAVLYYKFIDQPVRESMENAEIRLEEIQTEKLIVATRISRLRGMDAELTAVKEIDDIGTLYAYDNGKAEVTLLNDILSEALTYSISMATVSADGDLVRRNFSLEYSAQDYATACKIMKALANSPYRCRISDLNMQPSIAQDSAFITTGIVAVQLNAVFYETTASLE